MLKLRVLAGAVPLLLLLLFCGVSPAKAQGVSAYFGLGTATDKSSNEPLETAGSSDINGNPIVTPDVAPSLGGIFGTFGADYMWKAKLGFGGEYTWHLTQANFAPQEGYTYRPGFYDFNVIYHPINRTRIVPEIQGGIGGANIKFYYSETGCVANGIGCSTLSYYASSSNHFAVHMSGGVRFYIKGGLYIRPQVDVRWVDNFVEFGSDWVPEYSAVVGYTFGQH